MGYDEGVGSGVKRVKVMEEEFSFEGIVNREVSGEVKLERGKIREYLESAVRCVSCGDKEDVEVIKEMRSYLKDYSDDVYGELLEVVERVTVLDDGFKGVDNDFSESVNKIFSLSKEIFVWLGILKRYEFNCSEGCCREKTVKMLGEFAKIYRKILGNEEEKKVVNGIFGNWVMLMRELARMGIIEMEGMGLLNGAIGWEVEK